MADADDPWIDKDFEAAVRDTAYFLWENDGRPLGREKDYWFAALERCLRQREADGLLQQEPRSGTVAKNAQEADSDVPQDGALKGT